MAESTIARRSLASCVVVWVVLFGALAHPSSAVNYVVNIKSIDTPGGLRFSQQFSDAVGVLESATTYIQGAFSESQPKAIDTVTLTVDSFAGVAQTGGSEIELSSDYVASQPDDPAKMHFEIEGVLYHEMTHVWQNNNGAYGTDNFFSGTIEGVADWVRLTAGFPSAGWGPRAKGGNWYDGYTTTAYFLDWIATNKKPGFVNDLNLKMAQPWSNDFFQQIVGTGVDELWTEYQNSI